MQRGRQLLSACLVLAFIVATPGVTRGALPSSIAGHPLPTLADMLEEVTPGVVNVMTQGTVEISQNPLFRDPFFRFFFEDMPPTPQRRRQTQSLGSGVVVDARKGYVLTNHHVIANADEIAVTLHDGRILEAVVVGSDPDTDVAVIKIPPDRLKALEIADSNHLRVGDFVVAIGNPFGIGKTVTSGIVSALGRTNLGFEGYEDFIQTDASINPGNSGGALVNLAGELVGINTAILAPGSDGGNVGIGFAIPSNMAMSLMNQIVEHGEVRRGLLGVTAQDLTPELARAFDIEVTRGAVITKVTAGSAAEKAGIEPGDVVLKVNNKSIRSSSDLRNAVGLLRVGEKLTLDILRDGRRRRVKATIREPTEITTEGEELHPNLQGATFSEIPSNHPLYSRAQGAMLLELVRSSPAARTGLRVGDVITQVDRKSVSSVTELIDAVNLAGKSFNLTVQRGRRVFLLLLQ